MNQSDYVLTIERMISVQGQMSDKERAELSLWEKSKVTGDGLYATSDWPGWPAVIRRLQN